MALRSVSCGMTGLDVVAIQEGLNKFYNQWLLNPDGVFGNETNKYSPSVTRSFLKLMSRQESAKIR